MKQTSCHLYGISWIKPFITQLMFRATFKRSLIHIVHHLTALTFPASGHFQDSKGQMSESSERRLPVVKKWRMKRGHSLHSNHTESVSLFSRAVLSRGLQVVGKIKPCCTLYDERAECVIQAQGRHGHCCRLKGHIVFIPRLTGCFCLAANQMETLFG